MNNYFERIEQSILFIEENLTDAFSLEQVAQRGCFSLYHFHRVFHAVVGNSLKEYIRNRRLSYGAELLVTTDTKISEIAAECQYETPESFSRAFKLHFAVTPIEYRRKGGPITLFPRFSLPKHTFVKGDTSMEPAIITMPAMTIRGYRLQTTSVDGKNFEQIPQFWQQILANDCALPKVIPHVVDHNCSYGISTNVQEDGSFDYIIGYEVSGTADGTEDMYTVEIPEMTYAHFIAKGKIPDAIQYTNQYIYGTWFAEAPYVPAQMYELERYEAHRMVNPQSCECDILIPVKSKE